eukprot:scaffold27745_cov18-Tisochrysis_lutea.AAC.1
MDGCSNSRCYSYLRAASACLGVQSLKALSICCPIKMHALSFHCLVSQIMTTKPAGSHEQSCTLWCEKRRAPYTSVLFLADRLNNLRPCRAFMCAFGEVPKT